MTSYELIHSRDGLQSLETQWDRLLEKGEHTPFQEWAWHAAWWRHLGDSLGQRPFFVTAWNGSDLVAVLPLSIARGGNVLQWSAAEASDYCDLVAAKQDAVLAGKTLGKALAWFQGTDVRLTQVRPGSLAHDQFHRLGKFSSRDDFVCPLIRLNGAGFDEWLRTVDRKAVSEAGRRRRKLNAVGASRLRDVSEEDEIARFVPAMIADKQQWLCRRQARNILCTKEGEAFLSEALRALNRKGVAHVSAFECGSEVIARQIAFRKDGRYYYYFGAWDSSWKDFAPGRLMMLDLIRYAHDNKMEIFDMLRGEEDYKRAFASDASILVRFDLRLSPVTSFARLARRVARRVLG